MVMQYQTNQILYVALEDFQKARNAAPYIVCNIFEDLLQSHNISLLRADILSCKVSKNQAGELIRLTREFYMEEEKFQWVKKFNERPQEFDYEAFKNKYRHMHAIQ